MAQAEVQQWKLARQWMIERGVIPPIHPATKPSADLVDFARCLRDGVYLCMTLNKIKPNCVQFSPRPTMQVSYVRNINAFLTCCHEVFRIPENQLFEEGHLYDVTDFQKVIQLLSRLSRTPEALAQGWEPFPRDLEEESYAQEESIYANLEELAWSAQNIEDNVYDVVPVEEEEDIYGDDSIYAAIVTYQRVHTAMAHTHDEKKHHIMLELLETEKSFVSVLILIAETYQQALKPHLTQDDLILLFLMPSKLLPSHKKLIEGFEYCVNNPQMDVTAYFLNEHQGLLQYGVYAYTLPSATKRAKQLQESKELGKIMNETMTKSSQRFPLSDLLSVPMQRILKYPLLVKELLKCAEKKVPRNSADLTNLTAVLDTLQDIAKYINETKRDFEHMKLVNEIQCSINDWKGVTNLGRFRNDGEVKVKTDDEREAKKRWFFLFDKSLVVCNLQKKVLGIGPIRYYMKDVIEIVPITVVDLPNQHQGKKTVYPFRITVPVGASNTSGPHSMVCYSQAADIKDQWIKAFEESKRRARPHFYNQGHHDFELESFSNPSMCTVCSKLLWGTYFQGYMCQICLAPCHMECLASVNLCPSRPPDDMDQLSRRQNQLSVKPRFPLSIPKQDSHIPRPGTIYYAVEKYDHPLFVSATNTRRALMLAKGEEVEIAEACDSHWWEVISLKTGNKGKVPPSYLRKKEDARTGLSFPTPSPLSPRSPESESLRNRPYFVGCMSRLEAEQLLQGQKDGVFLIRESDQRYGQYAVALRWKKTPRHIKIQKHNTNNKLFVSDAKSFNNVVELVDYYRVNSLGLSFPGVDTTLRYPFKEVASTMGNGHSRRSVSESSRRPTSTSAIPFNQHHTPSDSKRISLPVHPEIQGQQSVRRTSSGATVQDSISPPLPSRVNGPDNDDGEWCVAMFNFTAEFPDELSIRTHSKIKILSKDTRKKDWWLGELQGKHGLFPANYVKEI